MSRDALLLCGSKQNLKCRPNTLNTRPAKLLVPKREVWSSYSCSRMMPEFNEYSVGSYDPYFVVMKGMSAVVETTFKTAWRLSVMWRQTAAAAGAEDHPLVERCILQLGCWSAFLCVLTIQLNKKTLKQSRNCSDPGAASTFVRTIHFENWPTRRRT